MPPSPPVREEVFTCTSSVLMMKHSRLTYLDLSVVIALVSAGAVVESDGGAEVSQEEDSGPRLIIFTRIIMLEVEIKVLEKKRFSIKVFNFD